MNKVCLVGNLTRDPELKTTQKGINVAIFTVAINNGKDKDGNERKADFINVYAYEKQAENISKYCKKGSKVGVEGRIKTSVTEKEDGTKYYNTFVAADFVEFISTKPKEDMPISEPDYTTSSTQTPIEEITTDPFAQFGSEVALSDEDLPF